MMAKTNNLVEVHVSKDLKDYIKDRIKGIESLRDKVRKTLEEGESIDHLKNDKNIQYINLDPFAEYKVSDVLLRSITYRKSFDYLNSVMIMCSLQDRNKLYLDQETVFYLFDIVEDYKQTIKDRQKYEEV